MANTFTADVQISSDASKLILGAGQDASVLYNGTNMIFDSQEVGSGDYLFNNGDIVLDLGDLDLTAGGINVAVGNILTGANGRIGHTGDANTYLQYAADTISTIAGNITFISCQNTTQDIIFFNSSQQDIDLKVSAAAAADESAFALFMQASTGRTCFGTGTPLGQITVEQPSATGAIPVVVIQQLDIDDTFINFIGTSAADSTRSISSSTAEAAAKFGAYRVEINGTTKWVRVYDSAV